jgi:threonine dehydratase
MQSLLVIAALIVAYGFVAGRLPASKSPRWAPLLSTGSASPASGAADCHDVVMLSSPAGAAEPLVVRADVEAAAERISGQVRTTPIVRAKVGGVDGRHEITFKLEQLQHTGSFKPRGMFNRLLSTDVPPAGVVIASGGNAGLAAAYAARRLGHHCTVFVPAGAPGAKVDRIRAEGGEVVATGDEYADALDASAYHAAATGAVVLHAYDQPEVVAGQGTCGRELARQAPDLDTVLVAVGGGGLIGGVAAWFAGGVRVVAVEPERAPTLHTARRAGGPVDVPVGGIAADALGARRLGEVAWTVAAVREPAPWIADALLVPDTAIVAARRWLWDHLRVVAEHGGATALAPLLSGAYRPARDERVAVIVCGANTDPAVH